MRPELPRDMLVALVVVAKGLYAAAVLALIALGRRTDARALAGFIPDCVVLVKRLMADPRVPRRRKLPLGLLAGYLASRPPRACAPGALRAARRRAVAAPRAALSTSS